MIFIEYNTPSSKNSKVWTGRYLISSPQTMKYIKNTENSWKEQKAPFLSLISNYEKPYKIGLYFVRDSKRRFDYNNASQIVTDLMKKYEWIEDDNAYELLPVFLGFSINKQKPGVYIIAMDKDYEDVLRINRLEIDTDIAKNVHSEI